MFMCFVLFLFITCFGGYFNVIAAAAAAAAEEEEDGGGGGGDDMEWYGKYGRKESWIVIRFGKY